MNEKVAQIFQKAKDFWGGLSRKIKLASIISLVLLIILIVIIVLASNVKDYVVLFGSGTLDATESGEIMKRLQEMENIDFQLKGNDILVSKDAEAAITMQLMIEGYPKSKFDDNSIFAQGSGLMSTDLEKKFYDVRQTEKRVSNMIKTINGIQEAVVSIALTSQDSFVFKEDQQPTTAAVKLITKPNFTLSNAQIKGIKRMVAFSVAGLDLDNVTITDSAGNELASDDSMVQDEQTKAKLEFEKTIAKELENKALAVLEPTYGTGNVKVSANVVLDYNDNIKENTSYVQNNDDRGVISKEEKVTETQKGSKTAGGVPGTESNAENPAEPTYPSVEDEGSGDFSRTEEYYDYLVDTAKEYIKKNSVDISFSSIAVNINTAELTDEERSGLELLVKAATNTSTVAIHNSQFVVETVPTGFFATLMQGNNLVIFIAVLVLVLMLAAVLTIVLVNNSRKKKALAAVNDEMAAQQASIAQYFGEKGENGESDEVNAIQIQEGKDVQLKKQIKDFATTNPEIVAQLLRTWLKGESDNYG